MLGEMQVLDDGLGEIGEGRGGFGLDVTLGYGGEEASERGTEIAGGNVVARQVIGDVLGSFLAGEGLRFFAGVKGTEIGMAGASRHAAAAGVGEGGGTQRGTVVGASGGHGVSRKKILVFGFFDFWKASRGAGRSFLRKKNIRRGVT